MNRSHSNDSLDTGSNGTILSSSDSSSPTDFTSDDEFIKSPDQLFANASQPLKSLVSRTSPNSNQFNKRTIENRHNNEGSNKCLNSDIFSPVPKTVGAMPSVELIPGLSLNTYLDHQADLMINRYKNRQALRVSSTGSTLESENSENIEALNDEKRLNLSIHQIVSPNSPGSRSNRRMNNGAARMCSRLLECRNLIEAIEFVEQNRDLINSLTDIITREAPAFRNYDINNYQIDYSVKESFNPDFWSDREPVVTTADGNCQYHAVSLSLTGCETYTPEVRLATAVAVIDNREWFDSVLKLIDRGTVLDLVCTIARSYSWGDETTLKAIAVAINRRIFLYTCNIGKKDYEMVRSLSKEELLDAFREKKYRGGTGIHTYADPLVRVNANNYIMLFHKSEHFIAVLPTCQQLTMFEPYNPIVPVFS